MADQRTVDELREIKEFLKEILAAIRADNGQLKSQKASQIDIETYQEKIAVLQTKHGE